MKKIISFGEAHTYSQLRNGMLDTRGLHLQHVYQNELEISAITSRGEKAKGYVSADIGTLPELVAALIEMHSQIAPAERERMRLVIQETLAKTDFPEEDAAALQDIGPRL